MYAEVFDLVQCGLTYEESWDVPVPLRRWWIERYRKMRQPNNEQPEQPHPLLRK